MKDSLEINPFLSERNDSGYWIRLLREIEAIGHFPWFMAEGSDEGSFESRLANVLDSIDGASKRLELSIGRGEREKRKKQNRFLTRTARKKCRERENQHSQR